MSEWIDVPVAEVAVGDSVKIKGYGRRHDSAFTFGGHESYPVVSVAGDDVTVDWMQGIPAPERYVSIVRSSIVAARRRKPEPAPKPGDWRCRKEDGSMTPCIWLGDKAERDALRDRLTTAEKCVSAAKSVIDGMEREIGGAHVDIIQKVAENAALKARVEELEGAIVDATQRANYSAWIVLDDMANAIRARKEASNGK